MHSREKGTYAIVEVGLFEIWTNRRLSGEQGDGIRQGFSAFRETPDIIRTKIVVRTCTARKLLFPQ